MSSTLSFERVTTNMTINVACLVVDAYGEVRVLVNTGSRLMSIANAEHQFAECRAEVDVPANEGEGKDRGCADGTSARFLSKCEAITIPQENIGEAVPSTLGDTISLALGDLKAVAHCLKKCEDMKDAAQGRVS